MTTGTLSIVCPACAATLKLKDQNALGKRVPCPKCKQPFVLERPQEEVPLAEVIDEPADEFDEFADFDIAAKPKRSRTQASASEFDNFDDIDDFDKLPKKAAVKKLPKKKKTDTAGKPKKAQKVYEDRETGGLGLAIAFGLAAGLVGALIWGGIGYATGYEVGWVAWGIGVACGAGVYAAGGDADDTVKGGIAVACALGSIALGKYLTVYFLMQYFAGELGIDLAEVAGVSVFSIIKETLGPFDALWVLLAAASAYKLGAGMGDDD